MPPDSALHMNYCLGNDGHFKGSLPAPSVSPGQEAPHRALAHNRCVLLTSSFNLVRTLEIVLASQVTPHAWLNLGCSHKSYKVVHGVELFSART